MAYELPLEMKEASMRVLLSLRISSTWAARYEVGLGVGVGLKLGVRLRGSG